MRPPHCLDVVKDLVQAVDAPSKACQLDVRPLPRSDGWWRQLERVDMDLAAGWDRHTRIVRGGKGAVIGTTPSR